METGKLSLTAKNIIQKIDEFDTGNQFDNNSAYFKINDLITIRTNIKRIKKEFESEKFFIVASGGLKSGKSTLINLLAHKKEVSTTGQGRETTLRPSLISAGDSDKIIIFTSLASGLKNSDKKELYDKSIDYLKGFLSLEELSDAKVKVSHEAYTQENINKYLSQKLLVGESEPLLINIQINKEDLQKYENSLLNKDIVFIDTPGIDGITSSVEGLNENHTNKNWLIERVDMMLFLQSSVTPINSLSNDYIKSLINACKTPHIRLVHNKFTLKPWREQYGIFDENKEDPDVTAIQNAINLFQNLTGETIVASNVDFAKAGDGFRYAKQQLIDESGFDNFEKELFEAIMKNKGEQHEAKIIQNLNNLIAENISASTNEGKVTLFSIKNKIEEQKTLFEEQRNQFLSIVNELNNFYKKPSKKILNDISQSYNHEEQSEDDGWELEEILNEVSHKDFTKLYFNISENVDKNKEELIKELEDACRSVSSSLTLKLIKNNFDAYILHSTTDKGSIIKELNKAFNSYFNDIQIEPFKLQIEPKINELIIEFNKIYAPTKLVGKITPSFFEKSISKDDIPQIKAEFNKRSRKWARETVKHFQETLVEEITNKFQEYAYNLNFQKEMFEKKLDDENRDMLQQIHHTNDMLEKFNKLFNDLDFIVKNKAI